MALKKADQTAEKPAPTEAELEAQRVAEAAAADQKKLDDEAAAKAEQEKADKESADKAEQEAAEAKAAEDKDKQEAADREAERLAREQELAEQEAASTRERLAQEEEVAKAAGKTPLERKLVLVESLTFSNLRQPSTSTWIEGKGIAHLLHDGWLNNQIASKLMKIVEE
jgi:uncharacterized protein YhaN